jgi:hypothetical protein
VYRYLFILLVAMSSLLLPTVGAAEEPAKVLMSIEAYPDPAGRVRIFTQKTYREDLDFTRDIIYIPYVSEGDHWDPDLRMETDGPVAVEYTPGNIEVRSTGPGLKRVRVWFTAPGALTGGPWGDRVYRVGWWIRPDFEEFRPTQLRARVVFPLGLTPDWRHSGVKVSYDSVPKVSVRGHNTWQVDEVLQPGGMPELEIAFRIPSAMTSPWVTSASLALSLVAFVLAVWTATRHGGLGSR